MVSDADFESKIPSINPTPGFPKVILCLSVFLNPNYPEFTNEWNKPGKNFV